MTVKPFFCIDDSQPCISQCRGCKETVAINHAYEQQKIEERERRKPDPIEDSYEYDPVHDMGPECEETDRTDSGGVRK